MPAQPLPFLDAPLPLAFAHRGGGVEREENTMAAFERAAALGFRYVETDVQASRDGVAVVIHDDTLERTLGVPGRVAEHSWRELRALVTPGGERLCKIEEALEAFPAIRFNIEPKSDAAVRPLAEAILRTGATARVCIGSECGRRTRALRRLLGPGLCWSPARGGVALLWLAAHGLPLPRLSHPCVQIPPVWRGIPLPTPRLIAEAHRRGIQVHVWTVDDAGEMDRLLDIGVDGIMTGRPSLLRRVLERRGQWSGTA